MDMTWIPLTRSLKEGLLPQKQHVKGTPSLTIKDECCLCHLAIGGMQRAAVTAKTPLRIKSKEVSEMNYDTSMQDREILHLPQVLLMDRKRQVKGRARLESRLKIQEYRQPIRFFLQPLTTPTALYQACDFELLRLKHHTFLPSKSLSLKRLSLNPQSKAIACSQRTFPMVADPRHPTESTSATNESVLKVALDHGKASCSNTINVCIAVSVIAPGPHFCMAMQVLL
ncbi:hypothetical protein AAG906_014280 [Vitis piasezkii]